MRIAVIAHSATRAGGVETYLAGVIPALMARGHEVACWFESAGEDHEPIVATAHQHPVWIATAGDDRFRSLREWRPDVIYHHGLRAVELERQLPGIAPVVFFAHSYYGSCISGEKATRVPAATPCHRVFGPACLGHYLPRRCGGLSPLTMVQQYGVQRQKQALLREYDAVLVASGHMAREYRAQSVTAEVLPLPAAAVTAAPAPRPRDRVTLLYLGRLERSKGVDVAIEGVARAATALERPVRLVVAGEGSQAHALQARAALVMRDRPQLSIEFAGWLTDGQRASALADADLLLVPSVWPEPFGLVGIEAGLSGVPSVAFDVGGIGDWLTDRVNGRLVPLAGDRADRFAAAIVDTLRHPDALESMRGAAATIARRFSMAAHLDGLERVLGDVRARSRRHAPQPA